MRLRANAAMLTLIPLGLAAVLAVHLRRSSTLGKRSGVPGQSIIDSAIDATISIDGRHRIVHANEAAARLFGTTVTAMCGMPLGHFVLHDLRTRASHADATQKPLFAPFPAQLRELSSALQTIREEERKHIARELHDDLGQLLATLRLDLALVQQHGDITVGLQTLMLGMDSLLATAITSLRRIAGNLRPRALDEGGLYFALQKLRHDFLLRQSIQFDLLADEADLALDDARSTAIYRIVQEAVTNIARHAQARHITIALQRNVSLLAISIHDDGKGIANDDMEKVASLGLLGMRERVWGLHGNIHIGADSEHGGTRIDIELPMHGHRALAQ